MYTKFIVVVDEDIKVRDWADMTRAITTRMDATHKWPGETNREWGRTLQMTPEVTARVDLMWQTLGL